MRPLLFIIINLIVFQCKTEVRQLSLEIKPVGILAKNEKLYWQKCHYGDVNQDSCEEPDRRYILFYCSDLRFKLKKEIDISECEYGRYHAATWKEAKYYCESFGNGWRLPTDKESLSLFDFSKLKTSLKIPVHKEYFPVIIQEQIRTGDSFTRIKSENGWEDFVTYMSAYWTSSLSPSNSSEAWVIDFDTGMLSLKNTASDRDRYLVKCVRNAN
jgi:uncharacterized protein (TIGR02145 family)